MQVKRRPVICATVSRMDCIEAMRWTAATSGSEDWIM
jgi:hypothetical protein